VTRQPHSSRSYVLAGLWLALEVGGCSAHPHPDSPTDCSWIADRLAPSTSRGCCVAMPILALNRCCARWSSVISLSVQAVPDQGGESGDRLGDRRAGLDVGAGGHCKGRQFALLGMEPGSRIVIAATPNAMSMTRGGSALPRLMAGPRFGNTQSTGPPEKPLALATGTRANDDHYPPEGRGEGR
jgi:hypothetical protein